jgi:hypothetical protein
MPCGQTLARDRCSGVRAISEGKGMADELDAIAILQERMPPFSKSLGIHFLSATPERVVAEMLVREDLCTTAVVTQTQIVLETHGSA